MDRNRRAPAAHAQLQDRAPVPEPVLLDLEEWRRLPPDGVGEGPGRPITLGITVGGMDSELHIHEATADNFDELVFAPRGELVIVDFWGPGCPNCDVFAADAPLLLKELPLERVRVVKVNAYEFPEIARRFALIGVPTFLLVRDGKLLGRMSQYYGRDYWLGVIRDHIPSSP